MKQNYLFIPTFVLNAMKRSLTKSQFGEVIASVANRIISGGDTPSPSISKGSDRYAFHEIVLEANKMRNLPSRGLRGRFSNGLALPLLNIIAMRDNLCNSDLAEVVLKAADYGNGVQVEPFDKSSAMAAYYSMLVHSMGVAQITDMAISGKPGKKNKSAQRTKGKKEANVQQAAETPDAAKVTESASTSELAEMPEAEKPVICAEEVNLPFIGETANAAEDTEPTFEQLTATFDGADNAEFIDKSRLLWGNLNIDERRAAFECAEKHKSMPEAPKYLYQYLTRKAWQDNNPANSSNQQ